jgi:hypothetical protein
MLSRCPSFATFSTWCPTRRKDGLGWFEAKSTLLQGRKPSEVIVTEPQAALNAAQRFLSRDD